MKDQEQQSCETQQKVKKKKLIKSCLYCRKRKLKCDRKLPMCSSCSSRNISECLYLNAHGEIINYSDLIISDQSGKIQHNCSNHNPSNVTTLVPNNKNHQKSAPNLTTTDPIPENPLLRAEFGVNKQNRIIYFGPTSIRCIFIQKQNNNSIPYLVKMFKEFKRFRKKEKICSNFTNLTELSSINAPYEYDEYIIRNRSLNTIISTIVKILPDSFTFIENIKFSFKTILQNYFQILDKNIVMSYISKYVEIDKDKGKIVDLKYMDKMNYYPIGILLLLFSFVYYDSGVPLPIIHFFILLEGSSTSKSLSIEKTQFLLLKLIYRFFNGMTGGDFSHMELSVGNLCNTCIALGFHRDFSKIYSTKILEKIGGIAIVENIWYWCLYFDAITSFEIGKPLLISINTYFNEDLLLSSQTHGNKPRFVLLKKFIHLCRSIMTDVLKPTGIPDLAGHTLKIWHFIQNNFQLLVNYIDERYSLKIDLFDYLLLNHLVKKYITLAFLDRVCLHNNSLEVENDILRASIIGMLLSKCLINICVVQENIEKLYRPLAAKNKLYLLYGLSIDSLLYIRVTLLFVILSEKCEQNKLNNITFIDDKVVEEELSTFKLDRLKDDKYKSMPISSRTIFSIMYYLIEKNRILQTEVCQQLSKYYLHFIMHKAFEKMTRTFFSNYYPELNPIYRMRMFDDEHETVIRSNHSAVKTGHNDDSTAFNDKSFVIKKKSDPNNSGQSATSPTPCMLSDYNVNVDKQYTIKNNDVIKSRDVNYNALITGTSIINRNNYNQSRLLDNEIYKYFHCSETEFFQLLNDDLENIVPT